MKYFCKSADKLPHPLPSMTRGKIYEVTPRKAFNEYARAAVGGKQNLAVKPLFKLGTMMHGKWMSVWGENISNKELFKRRLEGKVAKEILDI